MRDATDDRCDTEADAARLDQGGAAIPTDGVSRQIDTRSCKDANGDRAIVSNSGATAFGVLACDGFSMRLHRERG